MAVPLALGGLLLTFLLVFLTLRLLRCWGLCSMESFKPPHLILTSPWLKAEAVCTAQTALATHPLTAALPLSCRHLSCCAWQLPPSSVLSVGSRWQCAVCSQCVCTAPQHSTQRTPHAAGMAKLPSNPTEGPSSQADTAFRY